MSLVLTNELLKMASESKFAIPAFNVENMEMIDAVITTCEEMKSPVIIQTTTTTLDYFPPEIVKEIVSYFGKKVNIPISLHLDHGSSIDICKRCIDIGYSSVMIDGSKLPFLDNVAISKEVCSYGKMKNIPIECELGVVGGKEEVTDIDKGDIYTKVSDVEEFLKLTGCDSLAVAIGTSHGFYKDKPKLDFLRLKEINDISNVPLVLHGASGVCDEDLARAIDGGIRKINFATELRVAFTKGVRSSLEDINVYDPKVYNKKGMGTLKKAIEEKILICKSNNKV